MFGFLEPIRPVVRLSVVIVLAYMFFGCRSLLDTQALFEVRRWVSWSQLRTLVALAAMIVLVKTAQAALTDRPGYMAFNVYMMVIGVGAVAKPGVYLVAHIVYFGPWVIVAAMVWKPLCRLLHQHGLGLTLAVVVGFVHGLDSESRHAIYLVPLLVPFFVKATESLGWKTGTYAIVSALCAFGSEAWLNMKGTFVDNAFQYPDQLYWMHHGPFMSTETYLAHLAARSSWVRYFTSRASMAEGNLLNTKQSVKPGQSAWRQDMATGKEPHMPNRHFALPQVDRFKQMKIAGFFEEG